MAPRQILVNSCVFWVSYVRNLRAAVSHSKNPSDCIGCYMKVSQNKGYHFGGLYNKDYSISESILGSPCFGKLPIGFLIGDPRPFLLGLSTAKLLCCGSGFRVLALVPKAKHSHALLEHNLSQRQYYLFPNVDHSPFRIHCFLHMDGSEVLTNMPCRACWGNTPKPQILSPKPLGNTCSSRI